MTFDTALAGSGIVAASISGDVADAHLRGVHRTRRSRRRRSRSTRGNPHVAGFDAPEPARSRSRRGRPREADRPQRRRLPAGDGADGRRREAVGRARRALRSPRPRRAAATRWRDKEEAGRDPSTAPTTTRRARRRCSAIGETLAKQPRRRNVLLDFWSGEELGLLGSTAFVDASRRCRSISSPPISTSTWSAACRTTS